MQIRSILLLIVTLFSASCSNNRSEDVGNKEEDTVSEEEETSSPLKKKNILFFGNSLTAGYGLDSQEEAFPALIQQKIDSLELPYQVTNAGLSGETSAGGNERIDWILKQPVAIFVLELGANDGLRGIEPQTTYRNLGRIIQKVKEANPDCEIVLAGMMVPPSMGNSYTDEFQAIFPGLAEEHQITLIPFLLDEVAGVTKLNQQDGIHPTAAGQKIMAENVWKVLYPLIRD